MPEDEPAAPEARSQPDRTLDGERAATPEPSEPDRVGSTAADRTEARTEAQPAISSSRARPPLLVWVLTGLFVALMTMCTFLYPTFTGYDETVHVDMTYAYYNGHGFYAPGGRFLSIGVQRSDTATVPPTKPYSAVPVLPRGQRQSFDALGGDARGTYPIPNQMVQHPPLYYAIGAGVLHLLPGSHHYSYDRWVAVLRYLSILMLAPLPLLAWATTRALVGDGPAAVAAAALPLTLPNLARLGGSWNNDNGLTLLTAVLLLLLARVIAGDLRKRTGALVGAVTGLACLDKGYALVLPVVVVLAYVVATARHRQRRWPWPALGWAALFTAGIGAWWWIRNIVLFHRVQPEGFGGPGSFGYDTFYQTNHPRSGYTVEHFVPVFLSRVLWRTWGGIGYPEDPMFYQVVCWVWFGIVAAGALAAVVLGLRGHWGRAGAVALVLPVPLILAVPMINAVHHYTFNGLVPGAQGRYLYPAVTGVAVLVGVGYTRVLDALGAVGRRLSPWLPLVLVIGALGTQVLAWRQLVEVWWMPRGAHSRSSQVRHALQGIERWSPWPHPTTVASFVAVLVLGVLVLVAAVWYGWTHRTGPGQSLVTDNAVGEPSPLRGPVSVS